MNNIDVGDTLICISVITSIICYVILFLIGREQYKKDGELDDKSNYLLLFIGMTVPVINVCILVVCIVETVKDSNKKRKAIKDIPASLIKLTQTFIDAKDYEYIEANHRDGQPQLKNNKLEITVSASHLGFRTKLYSTNVFAPALNAVQKEKAENITEQLLDAYIKTKKGG